MTPHDANWGSLKASWQATPLTIVAAETLRSGLRWRMIWSRICLGIEVAAAGLMVMVVILQWTAGERGAALAVAVLTSAFAAATIWARAAASRGSLSSVVGMLDLSIARASRSIRLAVAGYAMTGACVVYVVVMYFSTIGPPGAQGDGDRAMVALGLLAVYAAATALYHLYVYRRRRRLTTWRDMLTGTEAAGLDASDGARR